MAETGIKSLLLIAALLAMAGAEAGAVAGAVTGAVTGVLAGLFGVGGGAITVPLLFDVFGRIGVEEAVRMPLAVGTSLAIIVPTSIRSARGGPCARWI